MPKKINVPRNAVMQGPNGSVQLQWSPRFEDRINGIVNHQQEVIDSEVLRLCSPMVPFRTGTLERSGTLGTVIGSGEVKYTAPYARRQYYNTAQSRSYDANRGGMWFERMKTKHKDHIKKLLEGDYGG